MNKNTISMIGKKLVFMVALVMMTSATMVAQKIASIDVNGILESMPEYKKAQTELDQSAAKWRQDIAKEYDKIKGMYNKYQAESVMMTDEMRKQKEDEIVAQETTVRQMQKAKFGPEGALFEKRQELVAPIQEQVYTAIEEYATDKGYDYIFDSGGATGIIFANPRYDKTDEVKKKLGIK
ncbi:MAG: OmpH family outer membrane protein [Saprospiraceae bacterium]